MKTFKVDFSKGINLVTDKRLLPEGYLVLADNIDLRSGSIRPFKMPEPFTTLPGGITSGTTCLWEFKNNWFFSSLYRQYAAEYVSSQSRVYFCETNIGGSYGVNHLIPQKVVNGIQAQLGTIVPSVSPIVTATLADSPSNIIITVGNSGSLSTGQYSYRISAVIGNDILPPNQAVIANIPQSGGVNVTNGSVNITWSPVANATGYIIFGRILGQEQVLFTMGAGSTNVVDNGSHAPSGAYASNYQPLNPLTYVYTYVRAVGTMEDESGPSPESNTVNSSYTRIVNRNPTIDGFYANATQYSDVVLASSDEAPLNMLGVAYNGVEPILTTQIIPNNYPWWVNGMKLIFSSDLTQTPYAFTIPLALAPVGAPSIAVFSTTGPTIPNGTYIYGVVAIKGASTTIYNYPSILPATTNVVSTASITLSTPSSLSISWAGVNGASGYMIIRYNGSVYSLVGVVTGNNTSYIDTNVIITALSGFPTVNNTGIIYNPITPGVPVSWENPSPVSVGQIINMSEIIPKSLLNTDQLIYLCASPAYGFTNSNATTAPVLTPTSGSNFSSGAYTVVVVAMLGPTILSYSKPTTITLSSTSNIQVAFTTITGATSYNIYWYVNASPFSNNLSGNYTSSPVNLVFGTIVTPGVLPYWGGIDQDVLNITAASSNNLLGLATYYQDSLGLLFYPNFINVFTVSNQTITTLFDVPNNGYIKYWNIYRAGDTGSTFTFVSQQPIGTLTFTDTIGTTGLGEALPTEYVDPYSNGEVVFQPPPADLLSPQVYNGMLCGIDGNYVRWTPTDLPDAWPSIYSQSFAFPPQCLLNYGGGLYVFCEHGIFRFDGNFPGQMSLTQLHADGCIAPFSPRIIGEHIIYLAKRGLTLINGMIANCITERFVPYRLITEPSAYLGGLEPFGDSIDGGHASTEFFGASLDGGNASTIFTSSISGGSAGSSQPFWWITTERNSAYGALLDAGMNPIPASDYFGLVTAKDKPITGLIYEARSFVWQNKYYLYYSNYPTNDFIGNPCWCVDLGIIQMAFTLPNYPISTLGFKPTDVHVSSTGECYALINIDPVNDPQNQTIFASAEAQFNQIFYPIISTITQSVYRFNPTFGQNVPIRFRTGEVTAGSPQTRKRWREARLNGYGTCQVRIFIDGALQIMANGLSANSLTLSESPMHPARILLPPGTWGYSISVEVCGDVNVRLIEFGFDPMAGEDRQGDEKE